LPAFIFNGLRPSKMAVHPCTAGSSAFCRASLGVILKRFPIDALKVDRSVIRDIPGGADDSAIVETIAQLEFVNSNLCQRAQGWLYSKAVSKQVVNEMLENPQKLANPATPKITFKSSAG
jgi:hypothetical protein